MAVSALLGLTSLALSASAATFVGCYNDRPLRKLASLGPSASPAHCFDKASALGYSVAGLKYGNECFGGAQRGYDAFGEIAAINCKFAFNGRQGLTWLGAVQGGGAWTMAVYRVSPGL